MSISAGSQTIQIAQVVPCTEAEGPGKRFAIWFQGCPLRCPGCCNPEFLPFKGGTEVAENALAELLSESKNTNGIEGITLLGGEPFAHVPAALTLAKIACNLNLSVMIFTGYTVEELQLRVDPEVAELIRLTDILVDGPYIREQPDLDRRWVGSRNQRIHFLSARYRFDQQWRQKNTIEIRLSGNEVTLNGFPAAHAVSLWKGWKRKKSLPMATTRTTQEADLR